MRITKEQLEAIASTEKSNVGWSQYEKVLMQCLRKEFSQGEMASARAFFGELFGVVNEKRTALNNLFAELFPEVMLNKEAKK